MLVNKSAILILTVFSWSFAFGQKNSETTPKPDDITPQQLVERAKRLTDLSAAGPLKLTAKVKLLGMAAGPQDAEYTLYWAGPENWRSEWHLKSLFQINVVADGKQWMQTNIPARAFRFLQLEAALQTVWEGRRYMTPLLPDTSDGVTEYKVVSRELGQRKVRCLQPKHTKLVPKCFDAESGLPLRDSGQFGTYLFGDYGEFRGAHVPEHIEVLGYGEQPAIAAQLSLESWSPTDASLLVAPAGVTASEVPNCQSDPANSGGKLVKLVRPKFPSNARLDGNEGLVTLYATISKNGTIRQLQVLQSAGPEFDRAALGAVKQWTYAPYSPCGKPLEVETIITVDFSFLR